MVTTFIASFALNFVIGIALVLILFLSVLKVSKTAREIFHVWMDVALNKLLGEFFEGAKAELLNPVKETKSTDAERRKRGELVVLEIGVGGGKNFKFYPPGTKLICVDPNRHFSKQFEENKREFPTVKIERFLHCGAEDIDEVGDGTVDVVVATHVLCSVYDVDKVIQQVKRVLVKGGKFYYADHVRAPGGVLVWIQKSLELFSKLFGSKGHLTRDIASAISKGGFSEVVQETKPLPKALRVFKHHTIGVATK